MININTQDTGPEKPESKHQRKKQRPGEPTPIAEQEKKKRSLWILHAHTLQDERVQLSNLVTLQVGETIFKFLNSFCLSVAELRDKWTIEIYFQMSFYSPIYCCYP